MPIEVGSVIRFRNRIWRVDRVDALEFAATPLDGRDTRRWRFLRSLEESNVQSGSLPKPDTATVSDPARQDLLLRAYRLSMIHGSAPFVGLQRSRAIPEPYQLVPLLMALDMPRVRMLIGDDVGVGKSIQAGLIISELMARGSAERLLVVVPAALREQWKETLDRFFHIDAVIMAGHTRPALERQLLPGQSPWQAFPAIITSIDYVKRRIGEVLAYRWDVMLLDEAHIAQRPHVWGNASNTQKERWEFLEAAGKSDKIKHMIQLSATPHPGFSDCFASLLEALNPACVTGNGDVVRSVAQRHVVQRRRLDIKKWYGASAPFPERVPQDIVIPLSKTEEALFEALRGYAATLAKSETGAVSQWVSLHLQRRALSSPGSILSSLEKRKRAIKGRAAAHTQSAAADLTEAESIVLDQDSAHDLEDEERWRRLDTAAIRGTEDEIKHIDELIAVAKKVTARQDGKLKRILSLLPELLTRHKKAPRVLIFTRYKDTLDYLSDALNKESKAGGALPGIKVFEIFGDMIQKTRRETYREFESTENAVCMATDCISEGLDLQRGCAELIHYELPWNPNRLEQRNGRIDRYGQPEPKVGIVTLVREDPLDIAILKVLVDKAQKIRHDHGYCPIIFSSARELKRLIREFGESQRQPLLPGFEWTEILSGVAEDDSRESTEKERIDRIMHESFYGQEQFRLPQVESALQQTFKTVGSPDEIKAFVLSALHQFNAQATEQKDGTWRIDLRGPQFGDLGESLDATFDPSIARDDPDLDLLDLAHPLVRRLVENVRYAAAGTEGGRVSARATRAVKEVTAVVHVLARFVTASEPPVLMEELLPLAFKPYGGKPPEASADELLRSPPQPLNWSRGDIQGAAAEALGTDELPALVEHAVETRRLQLVERQKEIARMASDWARGMDDVRVASTDLLTLTILIPHG